MIGPLKPYPEYRESGLPWLGRLPRHWRVRRMKSIVENAIEQTVAISADEVYVALEHVESWTGKTRPQRGMNMFSGQVKRFRPNDVLFGKLRPYLAKATRLPVMGVCAGEFFVLRVRDSSLTPAYLELQVRAKQTVDVINSSTFGAKMPRADWQFVGNLPIALPAPDEQAAIVLFLGWANGRLERAIRSKVKVIALLNEQKQAIIHQAVTRGLDPAVPLKPSRIPWLSHIPQHWSALRSKYIFREVDVRSASGDETHLSMSQRFGLVPSSQMEEKRLLSESYAGAKLCEQNDLVLNRLKAHLGVFALAPQRGLVSPDYTVLRAVRNLEPRYFEAAYRTPACRVELRRRAKGIVQGFWRLYTDDFYDIRMPIPPIDEQRRIVAQIDGDLSGVNTAIKRLEREIELLREYRTRLTADVVTGKLDVRGVQVPSDEIIEDAGPLMDAEEAEADEPELVEEAANAD